MNTASVGSNQNNCVITNSMYVNQLFDKVTDKTDKINNFIIDSLQKIDGLSTETKTKLIEKSNAFIHLNKSIKGNDVSIDTLQEKVCQILQQIENFKILYDILAERTDNQNIHLIREKLIKFDKKMMRAVINTDDLRQLEEKTKLQEGVQYFKRLQSVLNPIAKTLRFFRLPLPKEIELIENKIKALEELQARALLLKQKFLDFHYDLPLSYKSQEIKDSKKAFDEEIKAFNLEFVNECQSILNNLNEAQDQLKDMKKQ